MNSRFSGCFVKWQGNDLGLGKLLQHGETTSIVQYFDSPANSDWPCFEVPTSELKRVTLPSQTRAYFFDSALGAWRMGRVFDHIDDTIHIQLPNKQNARVSEQEVYVRWNKPLDDPWQHVIARLSESPYLHQWRSGLVRHLIRQRAASSGMTGLISAPVELHQHQIEVVQRVLADPVQRYLLADEVGLGKTIEAGIILRQHILDHPEHHNVLVIAPQALIPQWEGQLRDRCQLSVEYGHRISFAALEEIGDWVEFQPGFIVVDEAHQLARVGGAAFSSVRRLSDPKRCKNLLLLSATPVLRNEIGFLSLLHLLDPAVYDLDDVTGFRERIAKRQHLADLFASFTEDQMPFFLESAAMELASVFPEDRRLQGLLSDLRPLLESGEEDEKIREMVRHIRVHLSETYRLHRRILRNRRDERIAGLMTGRKNLMPYPWDSRHAARIHAVLEEWRATAAASVWGEEDSPTAKALSRVFIALWEATADLEALVFCAGHRLGHDAAVEAEAFGPLADLRVRRDLLDIPLFEGEEDILGKIVKLDRIASEYQQEHSKIIRQVINSLLESNLRVVCITSSPNAADVLASSLAGDPDLVIRHSTDSDEWTGRWRLSGPRVLICDWLAEEGLNLQGGDCCLIHLDLPFSPNRIEQRMGRLDRFGSGKGVISFVLKPAGALTFNAWATCLDKAWQVFSRSIAALQYVVEEEMSHLTLAFFLEGAEALDASRDKLAAPDGLEREFKLIRNQDALDSIQSPVTDGPESPKERIEEYEESDDELALLLHDWMSTCLKFNRVGEWNESDPVFRYHYSKKDRGTNTLMSVADLEHWFGPAIDRNAQHRIFRPPLTYPLTSRRETSIRRNCGLARLGSPVIESIRAHLSWDDRGTGFAMWRRVGDLDLPSPRMFFRLDFVVEADVDRESPVTGRLADAAFPPIVETIWIDQDLQAADDECLFELARPYHKPDDTNLTPVLWPEAISRTGCGNWSDLCDSVRGVAERLLTEKHGLQALANIRANAFTAARAMAKEQLLSRLDAMPQTLASERVALEREIEQARSLTRKLASGVQYPRIRLDSAGVVVLSCNSLEMIT